MSADVRVEGVKAIVWHDAIELRLLDAEARSIDTRELREWPAPGAEGADAIRRDAVRMVLGELVDVDPSIMQGTSSYRSLVAEFDRDAQALGATVGREPDGSSSGEWSVDRLEVQAWAIGRHAVMHYAATREVVPDIDRLARLDAQAGRAHHAQEADALIEEDRTYGQRILNYRARERVARDGWVVERIEGAVVDPVAVVGTERVATRAVEVLDEKARESPSGRPGAAEERDVVDRVGAELRHGPGASSRRAMLRTSQAAPQPPGATPAPDRSRDSASRGAA